MVSGQKPAPAGNPAKLAAEYALYMILYDPLERAKPCKICFLPPKTLTIRSSPPIRPRFLKMDEI
jgi:hypothetical protein